MPVFLPIDGNPSFVFGARGDNFKSKGFVPMKSASVENIVVDEAHDRTYVVMADRVLTDGELYSAIRIKLQQRGEPLGKGERLVITPAKR